MTFVDCITIFVLSLIAIAVLISILPTIGMLFADFLWFATSAVLGYLVLQASLNMVKFVVRMLRLFQYRSKKS